MPYASGKLRAMFAAIVDGLTEVSSWKVTAPLAESTIATAIVSPSARPRPSMAAETMPERPNGQHRHADHLPAGGAEGERRLLVEHRGLQEDLAADRGHDRQRP